MATVDQHLEYIDRRVPVSTHATLARAAVFAALALFCVAGWVAAVWLLVFAYAAFTH
jgi:hypothetical protein